MPRTDPIAPQRLYCYRSLGQVECFEGPQRDREGQLVNYYMADVMARLAPEKSGCPHTCGLPSDEPCDRCYSKGGAGFIFNKPEGYPLASDLEPFGRGRGYVSVTARSSDEASQSRADQRGRFSLNFGQSECGSARYGYDPHDPMRSNGDAPATLLVRGR